jgi:hypothetical protein
MIYPHLDLRLVSLLAGLWLIASHVFALVCSKPLQKWLKTFPRSKGAGAALLVVDSVWALVMIATMDLGEFTYLRTVLLVVIVVATYLTFRYVEEFLAVRALGIFVLLLAEPLIEAAFLRPEVGRLLLVVLAYGFAVMGMIWVGLPYVLRDQIEWIRKSGAAWKGAAVAGIVYGGLLAVFGLGRF